jgi:glycosyltransferase involved in cell wall biosynthesis
MRLSRRILYLDMSFVLQAYKNRQLEQALESRKLDGYFDYVVSVHPLAGLFPSDAQEFGAPRHTKLDDNHIFVEGTVGVTPWLRRLPAINLLIAQIQLLFRLYRVCRKERIDVIRIGDPYYLGLFGWLLAKLLGVPLVIRSCFDYDLLFATSGKAVFPRLFRYRWLEKKIETFIFARCDLVAGANLNNLQYAIKNGADSQKGVIFRYGNLIHPAHFTAPNDRNNVAKILSDLRISNKFLLTISRLEPMKQPHHNLLVLKELLAWGHLVTFVFIGDGSMHAELEKTAKELGVFEHVRFTGNQSQQFIADLLPYASVVLSPHMGRGLTEACLAGAPIVAYDYDWQGEIIKNCETGFLVPDGDWSSMALRAHELLLSSIKAKRLGAAARALALDMMEPKRLTQYEVSTYEKLLRGTL